MVTKLVILFAIAFLGLLKFSPGRLSPLAGSGVGGSFLGAATIFFAYEGFEPHLLRPRRHARSGTDLPRSLYLSIAVGRGCLHRGHPRFTDAGLGSHDCGDERRCVRCGWPSRGWVASGAGQRSWARCSLRGRRSTQPCSPRRDSSETRAGPVRCRCRSGVKTEVSRSSR